MAGKTDYAEGRVLNMFFGGVAYTPPTNLDLALYTTDPGETGGGTEVSGVGTGYVRKSVPNNGTNWVAGAQPNQRQNALAQEFAQATANWGTISHVAVFEGGTANMLYNGPLAATKTIASGDIFRIGVGELVVSED